jgi:hypothetical protein
VTGWGRLDAVAHFLYAPTMLGRRCARARWHHRLHLIPGRLLRAVCAAYEAELARIPAGIPGTVLACTEGHMSLSVSGVALPGGQCYCGRRLVPGTATASTATGPSTAVNREDGAR